MGGNLAGQNVNVFLLGGVTIFFCVILHFVYKIVFKSKKKEALQDENESNSGKFNIKRIQVAINYENKNNSLQ